jgi:GTP cyclohydrolase I
MTIDRTGLGTLREDLPNQALDVKKEKLLKTASRLIKVYKEMIARKSAKAATLLFKNAISSETKLAIRQFTK